MKHYYRVEVYESNNWNEVKHFAHVAVRFEHLQDAWEKSNAERTRVRVVRVRNGKDVEVAGDYKPQF